MDKPLRRSLKEYLETFGIDFRFIRRIGLEFKLERGKGKHSIKIYLPPHQLEMYQVFAIYMKLNQVSISSWTRELMMKEIKILMNSNDPLYEEAKILHRELREKQVLEYIKNSNNV